ncbi:MAG: nucleoside triphosphate pyrophosphohydrolase [Agriterribacter sp.]
MDTTGKAFLRLVGIMNDLREKCPWDKKQTIHTLRSLTIEETYELADAITENDWKGIKEELGDLLLHMVFYAKIGQEQEQFSLEEVLNGVCEKLIARHPHIYGDVQVNDEEEVKRNWEKLKLKEGKKSVLGGVPVSLPATVKAIRLQEKAKQVGFEWDETSQVWNKVQEEMAELQEAVKQNDKDAIEDEYGDLVFSLINYARFLHIDAESALERTNRKFMKRFNQMEAQAAANGKNLQDMTLEEMDSIWNQVKHQNNVS